MTELEAAELITTAELVDCADEPTAPDSAPTAPSFAGVETASSAVAALPTLTPANLHRGLELRESFNRARGSIDNDVAEALLEELVAGETGISLQLQDLEAALVGMLGRTIDNPQLMTAVLENLKDTVALGSAVRRRIEGSLQAVSGLRAQRAFIAAHPPRRVRRVGD